jgi:phage/plasmid-associated DNA primase
MLKAHTGGDTITARNLYQRDTVSWEPTHSITFLVNDAPSLEDIGPSMGSRVMVADFRHRYEGAAEDKTLYGTLHSEREGVLSILCWAAAAWFASWETKGEGISLPPRVVEQSKQFMERNDPIAECLREAFVVRPDANCPAQVAYDTYKEWHARSGREDDPVSNVKFVTALEKRGLRKVRGRSFNIWNGLKPLSAVEVADDEDDE